MSFSSEIYYHGTIKSFDKFEKVKKPNFTSPQKHLGFFFTDNPDYAAAYARDFKNYSNEGANIRPVYLDIKNPKYEDGELITEIEEKWKQYEAKQYVADLKAKGYDSIIFENVEYKCCGKIICQEIVVFESEQIKSIFE